MKLEDPCTCQQRQWVAWWSVEVVVLPVGPHPQLARRAAVERYAAEATVKPPHKMAKG